MISWRETKREKGGGVDKVPRQRGCLSEKHMEPTCLGSYFNRCAYYALMTMNLTTLMAPRFILNYRLSCRIEADNPLLLLIGATNSYAFITRKSKIFCVKISEQFNIIYTAKRLKNISHYSQNGIFSTTSKYAN